MKNLDVIRAWKDEEYRLSMSDEERAMMPANPAGFLELTETDLADVGGGSEGSGGSGNIIWTIPLTIGLSILLCFPNSAG